MPESGKTAPAFGIRSVTRRRFVGAATGAIAAPLLVGNAVGQDVFNATPNSGTPIASPDVAINIDVDALAKLSETLVGGGQLSQKAVEPLAKLIGADQALASGFEELVKIDDPTTDDAKASMSDNASATMKNILIYWYEGSFGDQPVENRADILFGLPVWSTVPYITLPTVCKGFGYWATEVLIEDATPEGGS